MNEMREANPEALNGALLGFFKALADPMRLRVAGRLAERAWSAGQLADAMGERKPAVLQALLNLAEAGLVSGPEGPAELYRLRLDHIHALARQLMPPESRLDLPEDAEVDAFERKVLKDYVRADNTLKQLPPPEKKLRVVLNYLLAAFEPGRRYSEKEVNLILKRYHPDSAYLRRAMVNRGLLARERDGKEYWLPEAAAEQSGG